MTLRLASNYSVKSNQKRLRPPPIILPLRKKHMSPLNSPLNSPSTPQIIYDYNPSLIIEENGVKIFLGTREHSEDLTFIQNENIKAVVCVMKDPPILKEGINFLHISIEDLPSEKISDHFDNFIKFINDNIQKKNNIFVHCYMGISRSPSFIIAYLIKIKKMKYIDALNFVKSKRAQVEPNIGFEFILQGISK